MKIEEKVTVRLSAEDIKELIVTHLKSEGYDIESIYFNIESQPSGYFGEYESKFFSGAVCKAKRQ
ncbi:hypothetical protein D3C73_278710 [compost metagenome]